MVFLKHDCKPQTITNNRAEMFSWFNLKTDQMFHLFLKQKWWNISNKSDERLYCVSLFYIILNWAFLGLDKRTDFHSDLFFFFFAAFSWIFNLCSQFLVQFSFQSFCSLCWVCFDRGLGSVPTGHTATCKVEDWELIYMTAAFCFFFYYFSCLWFWPHIHG